MIDESMADKLKYLGWYYSYIPQADNPYQLFDHEDCGYIIDFDTLDGMLEYVDAVYAVKNVEKSVTPNVKIDVVTRESLLEYVNNAFREHAENSDTRDEIDKIQDSIDSIDRDLLRHHDSIDSINTELTSHQEIIDSTDRILVVHQDSIDMLKSRMDAVVKREAELEEVVKENSDSIVTSETVIDSMAKRIDSLKKQINSIDNEVAKLKVQHTTSCDAINPEDIDNLKEAVANHNDILSKILDSWEVEDKEDEDRDWTREDWLEHNPDEVCNNLKKMQDNGEI